MPLPKCLRNETRRRPHALCSNGLSRAASPISFSNATKCTHQFSVKVMLSNGCHSFGRSSMVDASSSIAAPTTSSAVILAICGGGGGDDVAHFDFLFFS